MRNTKTGRGAGGTGHATVPTHAIVLPYVPANSNKEMLLPLDLQGSAPMGGGGGGGFRWMTVQILKYLPTPLHH